MKELLYKQVRLVAHPMTFVFLICGAMILIPNYPYTVSFFYVTLGIFFSFLNGREQRDNDYTALLPIRKRDTVKASVLFIILLEILSIAVSSLFILLSNKLMQGNNNLAGVDANPALLGMGFLVYAVFNGIFLPSFYRSGYKVGIAFLKSGIGVFIIVGIDIIIPHILPWFDGHNSTQFIFLAAAAALYTLVTFLSYKRSAKLFERVDL